MPGTIDTPQNRDHGRHQPLGDPGCHRRGGEIPRRGRGGARRFAAGLWVELKTPEREGVPAETFPRTSFKFSHERQIPAIASRCPPGKAFGAKHSIVRVSFRSDR